MRVAPFVLALAVVQEREELRDQKICTARPRHCHGMVSHPAPMMATVRAIPIELEPAADVREQTATVVAGVVQGAVGQGGGHRGRAAAAGV
jgi:hypothetical protein